MWVNMQYMGMGVSTFLAPEKLKRRFWHMKMDCWNMLVMICFGGMAKYNSEAQLYKLVFKECEMMTLLHHG